MLTDLSIRDVVLIDRLDLDLTPGLSVLTGETGAGKSILLDALGLALGARAEARLVRHGCDQAVVIASFEIADDHPAHEMLHEQGLESDSHLILRRLLSADGRSRAFINDQPVGVTLLRQLGETLVEIQGQFDQHGLLNPATHIDVLDSYAQLMRERKACGNAFQAWQNAETALKDAIRAADQAKEDEEYLRHSLDELEKFGPDDNEEDTLSAERSLLQNAEKLTEAISTAFDKLNGARGADDCLRQAQKALERLIDKAEGHLDGALGALDRASVEIQEAISQLNSAASEVSANDQHLEHVEERLFALRDLARKHNVHPDALPALIEKFRQDIALINDSEEALLRLQQEAKAARENYIAKAEALSKKRQTAAKRLNQAVNTELPPLKMDKATFITTVQPLEDGHWNANGMDQVAFQVMTNPGAPAGPLSKIASGGELSRFLLALKVSLAEIGSVPTLVFDEIDSGVGGATAAAIGDRLGRLAGNVQLLVITHSPQVAAAGRDHWNVAKSMNGKSMVTSVNRLMGQERREEVARMLSGSEITEEARAAADRLLGPVPA
ncbi:DNA repair protein RecN [Aestuariispira insulae]|uniref:DNA repair protein RecN n=1 Tax=Aestuariispira insulae TaxID=1461337 RepID=A0A3D9HX89_9PROT|nr:DNA repair protein RecN [Aestuariispira insulae]RED54123.1 DNA replication and repair protein RecN [Aestuariispira insulae]